MTEESLRSRVRRHLEFIYPTLPLDRLIDDVLSTLGLAGTEGVAASGPRWDQHEVAVITYADSITEAGKVPMQTMHELLDDLTGDVVSVVHVLPFYPASSDGGFAITDHRAVDARLGSWDDIVDLSETYTVMADLVVNHVSADHPWMEQFCSGEEPGSRYLLTAEPSDDLSSVVRPRTTPLLREVETPEGPRLLWCTFSYDQIDLNFAEPEVLLDLLRTVARLVDAGVRWFRLDAIAYLWKELGTSCVNLPQTHEFVKLLRTLLDARCPDSVIITETNVPHDQNVAYWGDGDEAHLVYNFSLPPLVAHTMLSGFIGGDAAVAGAVGDAACGNVVLQLHRQPRRHRVAPGGGTAERGRDQPAHRRGAQRRRHALGVRHACGPQGVRAERVAVGPLRR